MADAELRPRAEELVTPAPRAMHQLAVWALYDRIKPYVARHGLGVVGSSPADLDLLSGQLVQPDLFVIAPLPRGREVAWSDFGIPLLVVEVLSPSTAFADRNRKRNRYQKAGIPEYWIVDADARLIERWKPHDELPEILSERLVWQPSPELPRSSWTCRSTSGRSGEIRNSMSPNVLISAFIALSSSKLVIWIVRWGEDFPRLVTAYAGVRR